MFNSCLVVKEYNDIIILVNNSKNMTLMEKKVTRKEFLLSTLSVVGLLAVSKAPSLVKNTLSQFNKPKNLANSYGNNSYGGENKNA